MTILDEIVAHKRLEVAKAKKRMPLARIQNQPYPQVRDLRAALNSVGISIIAEIKRKSPSAGLIREDFDPVQIGHIYESAGADAISILTDETFFGGHNIFLSSVKSEINVPVLRKEFIIDPYQIYEARSIGADAILLIAAILELDELQQFIDLANQLDIDALVEVHTEEELKKVLGTEANLIGINNRDLKTFVTDIETSIRLKQNIPDSIVTVSESGIRSHADLKRLEDSGFDAVLVGESLMRAPDIGLQLQTLQGERA